MDEHTARTTLINPFYAITIDPYLFREHQPWVTKHEWIAWNALLLEEADIAESGIEAYLRDFLAFMHSADPSRRKASLRSFKSFPSNPCLAITLSPDLDGPHKPLISRAKWIAANTRLIEELGAEAWLAQLLATLEGNFPRSEDSLGHRHP